MLGFGVIWWSIATVLTPVAAKLGLPFLLVTRAFMGVGEVSSLVYHYCVPLLFTLTVYLMEIEKSSIIWKTVHCLYKHMMNASLHSHFYFLMFFHGKSCARFSYMLESCVLLEINYLYLC